MSPASPLRGHPGWVTAALALLGGVVTGGALVALVAMLVVADPATGVVSGTALSGDPLDDPMAISELPSLMGTGPTAAADLIVDVAGAVAHPGLHRLRPGDRVGDAIEAAGGFGPRVDLTEASRSLNLAQPLEDGVKVLVPELGLDGAGPATVDDGRIDLNRADQAALESLPGIGPVTARKIIDAREAARFDAVRELRSRSVVGQAVFDDVKDLVRVSP